jgi:hypothetical protein
MHVCVLNSMQLTWTPSGGGELACKIVSKCAMRCCCSQTSYVILCDNYALRES